MNLKQYTLRVYKGTMNTCYSIKTMLFNRPQLESFLSAHSAANQSSFRLVICRCANRHRMAMQSVDKGRETQARRCQSLSWNALRFSANLRADCAIPGAMSFHNGCTRYYCCTLRSLRFELKEKAAFLKMLARIGGCCKTTPLLCIIKYSVWQNLLGPIQHLSYLHPQPSHNAFSRGQIHLMPRLNAVNMFLLWRLAAAIGSCESCASAISS